MAGAGICIIVGARCGHEGYIIISKRGLREFSAGPDNTSETQSEQLSLQCVLPLLQCAVVVHMPATLPQVPLPVVDDLKRARVAASALC
eukprot:scaffold1265_cov366-Prasinococcus_capsulatus_cf.AAC.10